MTTNSLTPQFPKKLPGTFWGITAFFNPAKYENKVGNYRLFRESAKRQGLKLITVELSFGEIPFELTKEDADILIQLEGDRNNIMWQKERLFNIALKHLPADCDKVGWFDCDIIFKNDHWIQETSALLEKYIAVQPFQSAIRLPPGVDDMSKEEVTEFLSGEGLQQMLNGGGYRMSLAVDKNKDLSKVIDNPSMRGHPGFAFCYRRELLDTYGFYDYFITGGFDNMGMAALYGQHQSIKYLRMRFSKALLLHFDEWANRVYQAVRGSVFYTPGTIFHLWHGSLGDRFYGYKEQLLRHFNFMPQLEIKIDEQGAWAWNTHKKVLCRSVIECFRLRSEDGFVGGVFVEFLRRKLDKESLAKTAEIEELRARIDRILNVPGYPVLKALHAIYQRILPGERARAIVGKTGHFLKSLFKAGATFYVRTLMLWQRQRLSVVILNWKRPDMVEERVRQYAKYDFVDDIIVWNNNKEMILKFADLPKVKTINCNQDNGLDTRFAACLLANNDAVLIQDEDLFVPEYSLRSLFREYLKRPQLIHSVCGRSLMDAKYSSKRTFGNVDIVLTRCEIINRKYVYEFFKKADIFDYIRRFHCGNGEDIILNYLVRAINNARNVAYPFPYTDFEKDPLVMKEAMSSLDPLHFMIRQEITNYCRELLLKEILHFIPDRKLTGEAKHRDFQLPVKGIFNKVTKTSPIFIHAAPGAQADHLWLTLVRRAFHNIKDLKLPAQTTVLAWGNEKIGLFEESCGYHDIPLVKMNGGELNPADKWNILRSALDKVTTEYVIFLDSDVTFLNNLNRVEEIFESFHCEMLFGASIGTDVVDLPTLRRQEKLPKALDAKWKYLNSSMWMAKTVYLKGLLNKSQELFRDPAVPLQVSFAKMYVEHSPAVQVDHDCRLFQDITVGKDYLGRFLTVREEGGVDELKLQPYSCATLLFNDGLAPAYDRLEQESIKHLYVNAIMHAVDHQVAERFPWVRTYILSENIDVEKFKEALKLLRMA